MGRDGLNPDDFGAHPGTSLPEREPAAEVDRAHRPEVRYHPLGVIDFVQTGAPNQWTDPVRVHMCLRCGAVVVAAETARHDLDHIQSAGGHIPEGDWAHLNRAVSL